MKLLETLRTHSSVWILVLVVIAALGRVLHVESAKEAPDKRNIRIVHWQMESGVREAVDAVAREYERLHPDVSIQQIVIGERGYGTWVTTRLIGGTAPDLVSMGQIEESLIHPLFQRYFLPLSGEIEKPNPYNAGTDLEGVPWKGTYYDDMAGGYVEKLLEYYSVPSSAHTVRIFYNKDLFKAATGLDAPPRDFRGFIKACGKIREYGRSRGETLVPIAGSGKYNTRILLGRFDQAVNSSLIGVTDANHDSEVTNEESIVALVSGAVPFDDPRVVAMFQGRDYYNREFQPAFFSADRMDAAFLFLQQRALMIASGSWDAASYMHQADFPIGICEFPLPDREDPEFGKFVEGSAVEVLQGGFSFSVNRLSPHADVALDFLRFLSSQKMNALLNSRMKWIPMVRGNRPDPSIAAFWPNLDGVKTGIAMGGGPLNDQELDRLTNLHAAGRLEYTELLKQYREGYVLRADDWMRSDVPRSGKLAGIQEEFAKTVARESAWTDGAAPAKALLVFEGQISRSHDLAEITSRYEEARQNSPLPK